MAKRKTSRFWLGRLDTTHVRHVFDGDSPYPEIARCGTAHFANCVDRENAEVQFPIDLLVRNGSNTLCNRCRMSLTYEIWRNNNGTNQLIK
jgi:hypothetical protein